MAVLLNDLGGLATFDCGETQNIGTRWKRWIRAFEFFAEGKGVGEPKQKRSLLLHAAGMAVQDIYHTLIISDPGEDSDVYKALNGYFTPHVNVPFERHVFRNMAQKDNETVEQYITRLREKATTCDFGDDRVDEHIRDQIIEKCASHKLRLKLLEKGKALTLKQVSDFARAMEQAESQASEIEGENKVVNRLSNQRISSHNQSKPFQNQQGRKKYSKPSGYTCYSCGRDGHISGDTRCPARGKLCRYCRGHGHFESCCLKKKKKQDTDKREKPRRVRQVGEDQVFEGPDDHAFMINLIGKPRGTALDVEVGGVEIPVIIDSGASCNVTDQKQWEMLKNSCIKCVSENTSKSLYAYGQKEPLPVAGVFWASVQQGERRLNNVEFIVIEGEGQTLLGLETATKLGVLHIGPHVNTDPQVNADPKVNAVLVEDKFVRKYAKCFQGFGKLKDFQLHIPIDKDITPVVQPVRRVPFNLREPLERKLEELETLDIIEKVAGPTVWASPVVVIPKSNDDIRLCVDMRVANEAVQRERYPIPTVDEVLHDMNQSSVFSKLDIKWAYHQVKLDEQSREITTFVTHKGLYRYKRLMFGISCAPEMYQRL